MAPERSTRWKNGFKVPQYRTLYAAGFQDNQLALTILGLF